MSIVKLGLPFAFLLSGCASTFIETDKNWKPKGMQEAVVVHFSVVDQSAQGSKNLLEAVVDIANAIQGKKSQLGVAGDKAFARVKPVFYQYDMKLGFDSEAAKRVTQIQGVWKSKREKGGGGLLGKGDWLHPETVEEPFHLPGAFFMDKFYKAVAKEVLQNKPGKVAVSMGMTFVRESSWWIGWECVATFRARAIDHRGKPVFLVSSVGSSSWYFGGGDRYLTEACPDAATNAVQNLGEETPGDI